MKVLYKIIKFIAQRIIGRQSIIKFIGILSRSVDMEVIHVAYWHMGIMKFNLEEESTGEHFLINNILKRYLPKNPVLFDVGANVGSFSRILREAFPKGTIYAFEPNELTFKQLKDNTEGQNINIYQLGLGAEEGEATLYAYDDIEVSQLATMYSDVLTDIHKCEQNVVEYKFTITTIDSFCKAYAIKAIDFLKIDTEGNEYQVLKGGVNALPNYSIKFILFEFNEMNIISRVFLKDFYDLLPFYNFYRLDTDRIIPLFSYQSKNEIFKFQNILAIHKSILI